MGLGRLVLRFGGAVLRFIQLCAAAVVLAVWAYFVHELRRDDLPVSDRSKAILGLSAAATIWALAGTIFTICLGSVVFFGIVAIVLDLALMGAFIWVSYTLRAGRHSCGNGDFFYYNNNYDNYSFGVSGNGDCHLYRASFAFAIILTVLLFITALWQGVMMKRGDRAPRKSSV